MIANFANNLKKFVIKNILFLQIVIFLILLFCLMFIKYKIAKYTNESNKIKHEIEKQIVIQQDLKINLQQKLSIENLKQISNKFLPNHNYTDSNRIILPERTEKE